MQGDWLAQITESAFKSFYGEGERLVRIKALSVGIRIVQGVRAALFLHYLIQVLCFLCAFSLFFGAYLAVEQYSKEGGLHFTWPLAFCWGLFIVVAGILAITLRERYWVRALRIEEIIDRTLGTSAQPEGHESEEIGASVQIDPHQLEQAIERVVERKLKRQQRGTRKMKAAS